MIIYQGNIKYLWQKNPTQSLRIAITTEPLSRQNFHPENAVCFLHLLHLLKIHFRLLFLMDANTMNSDQTAPIGAV